MEQLKSRQSLEDDENINIEWPVPGEKCSEEPTHHSKELQNRVANTGLAVYRTIQRTLNNHCTSTVHGRAARKKHFLWPQNKNKCLKYAKKNIEKFEVMFNFVPFRGQVHFCSPQY